MFNMSNLNMTKNIQYLSQNYPEWWRYLHFSNKDIHTHSLQKRKECSVCVSVTAYITYK